MPFTIRSTPPAGWPFRDAAGDPVQILTGWTGRFSEHGAILGFRHTIPVGGWTIVGNFDSSAPWLAELPNGRDIELTLSTSEDVVRANLTEGSEWIWTMRFPGDSVDSARNVFNGILNDTATLAEQALVEIRIVGA